MKHFIFATVFLLLIFINYATKLRKASRKVKKTKAKKETKTKADYGSGSWNDGFNCPEILTAHGNAVYKVEGGAKFYPTHLQKPTTPEEKIGWVFEFAKEPEANLKKYFTKIGNTNRYYLPFRLISSTAKYVNPTGYKYIEFWVTTDALENFRFRINLPWKYFGWYINDTEGELICNLLNSARSLHKGIITSSKAALTSASAEYITTKPLFDKSVSKNADLTKQKEDLNVQLNTDQTKLTALQAERTKLEADYNKINDELTELAKKTSELRQTLNKANIEIQTQSDTLKTLENKASSEEEVKNILSKETDSSLSKVTTQVTTLKGLAPNKSTDVNAAEEAIKKLDAKTAKTKIDSIAPIN